MKNKHNFFLIGIFLFSIEVAASPTAAVTVKVTDEKGASVEGASVTYGFRENFFEKGKTVITDEHGFASISAASKSPNIGITIKKDQYYESSLSYDFLGPEADYKNNISGVIGVRHWEPYNPIVNVVLNKIIQPIPLFVARAVISVSEPFPITIPAVDNWVGYDLLKADWVAPYGEGATADFLFKLHRGDVEYDKYYWPISYNATLEIKFSNDGDGIQEFYREYEVGSKLISSHHAPVEGYENYLLLPTDQKKTNTGRTKKSGLVYVGVDKNRKIERDKRGINYYFRIRAKKDSSGNIISAMYGKIYGFFEWDLLARDKEKDFSLKEETYGKTGGVTFLYYVNPAINDTNLEYNRKVNLNSKDKYPKKWKP